MGTPDAVQYTDEIKEYERLFRDAGGWHDRRTAGQQEGKK